MYTNWILDFYIIMSTNKYIHKIKAPIKVILLNLIKCTVTLDCKTFDLKKKPMFYSYHRMISTIII